MRFQVEGGPVAAGSVTRSGVRTAWQLYGSGEPAFLLLPCWSIIHSRHWKMQVPYLARHGRVLVVEGRGNGDSDRPSSPEAYADEEFAADALAALDAARIERAWLLSLSAGGRFALAFAGAHPERLAGAVFIAPAVSFEGSGNPRAFRLAQFNEPQPAYEGWQKYNANYWRADHRGFLEFFFSQVFSEPHSTKPFEDCLGWGLDTDAETLIATAWGPSIEGPDARRLAAGLRCPVLVIHGDKDGIVSPKAGAALAEVSGAHHLAFGGSGHCPHVRDPVAVNLAIRDFCLPASPPRRRSRSLARPRRALFVSSPIGLGHARRDLAIAASLRSLVPALEIDWLAQPPVTGMLEEHGERVHPASRLLANESAHIESRSASHRLHVFQAWREMDEILLANFMVFLDVVAEEEYDLWVGDEAWELDHHLFENPSLKRAPYAWLTDFVGWLPVGSEERLTADYNAEMIEHVARYPRLRDRAIFIGQPEDVTPEAFGPGLPSIREWTEENYRFSSGYAFELEPGLEDRAALRRSLGFADGEVVAVAAVGGSAVGGALLSRLIASYPAARALIPGLRLIAVAGPRLPTSALTSVEGVEVRAFVPDLNRVLAACDIGLVQGGLTTTMELAAYGRPFLYFPLRDHCEQQFHVRRRLERYGAGRCLQFDSATPETIASAMADVLAGGQPRIPVESGAARRAAEMIAELL